MCRKLFLLVSFLSVLALVGTNLALGDVIQATPASGSDDNEEGVWEGSDGVMEGWDSTDLEFPYEGALTDNEPQVVGVRFVDVQIPKGSTILSAYVQFDADDIDNDYHVPEVHLLVDGELSPNPVTFEDTPYNITSRPRTAAVVEWDPAQWMETHLRSADEATSDISSIIQEIVNQDGWAAGNALVLFFRDNPANPSAGIREAESFDGAGDNIERRPTLHVEFEAAPAAPALPEGWQSQDIGTTGGSAAESDGTWAISADGADVWGSADEFHYAYVPLSGDGTIIARVVSNGEGSNGWAKGGVMIRETLDADSKHAIMALTGGEGGGMAFQNRQETAGSSFSSHGDPAAAPPYWVKLTRVGNTITGYSSADGVEWVQQPDGTGGDMTTNPVDIETAEDVYIGLFVTSHASGELRTYLFENVSIEVPIPALEPVDPGTDNLIAYYPLDIDTLDASGNGNDGTVNGDPTFVDGMVGTAMEFDGTGDFLDCGNNPILALTDAVSISAWIKVAVQNADHKVGGNQDGANGGYKMSVYSNKIEFEIRTAGNSAVLNRSVAGGTLLEVDVWYHVTGVYSLADGYIRTYVNGELDRELLTTEALGASPGALMIGCEPFSTGQYNFNGVMDDIRVYNKALSEDEARYLGNN